MPDMTPQTPEEQVQAIGRLPLDYGEAHKFEASEELRVSFLRVGKDILDALPASRNRSVALTHLEDSWFRVAAALGDIE